METLELMERISNGEDSYTQFKQQAITAKDLAKEFVAFSNANGGIIIFGVVDDGEIKGLNESEIQNIGQLVGNTANENVKPPIHPLIKNMAIDDKKVMVIFIKDGSNKPYKTSSGVFYTKSGADKKPISDEELKRLFAESKRLYADEEMVYDSDISDLNTQIFYEYLKKDNNAIYEKLKKDELNLRQVLQNRIIMNNDKLTLAGNLIFGIEPQRFAQTKSFYIDCCYFDGNDISVNQYKSQERVYGDFKTLYKNSFNFLASNLRKIQIEENFNSNGVIEIDEIVLGELITNALVHRDYLINSPIRIFMFNNRVEIISPGKLPNSLTVENIKVGSTIRRNQIIESICKNILTYSGYGSGIKRVLEINPDVEFINDIDKEEFKCIIPRNTQEKK